MPPYKKTSPSTMEGKANNHLGDRLRPRKLRLKGEGDKRVQEQVIVTAAGWPFYFFLAAECTNYGIVSQRARPAGDRPFRSFLTSCRCVSLLQIRPFLRQPLSISLKQNSGKNLQTVYDSDYLECGIKRGWVPLSRTISA